MQHQMAAKWMNELVNRIRDNENHEDAAVDREQANYFHDFQLKQSP